MFKFGWVRDFPDNRDLLYSIEKPIQLPEFINLRDKCPPVFNQYQLGSCTANAVANAHLFCQMKQPGGLNITPSRLFIYYNAREVRGWEKYDSGSAIRDAVKMVSKKGTCSEDEWPYIVEKFTKKPNKLCYVKGKEYQVLKYYSVPQTLRGMQQCLATGFPIVFGFTIFENFMSDYVAKTGDALLPSNDEKSYGGHAVLCVGYDNDSKRFLVMNSWGSDWGKEGYFTLPYDYVLNPNLAADFWTIRFVEEGEESEDKVVGFDFSSITIS